MGGWEGYVTAQLSCLEFHAKFLGKTLEMQPLMADCCSWTAYSFCQYPKLSSEFTSVFPSASHRAGVSTTSVVSDLGIHQCLSFPSALVSSAGSYIT